MVGLAGFVDAAAGGGGIISIPAYMFVGIPAHFALGCNKFSSTCGTTLTVFRFWKSGAIDIRSSLIAAAGSFAGSALGAKTALMLSDQAGGARVSAPSRAMAPAKRMVLVILSDIRFPFL